MNPLKLKGVKQNNLKDLTLEIPLGKSVVITGPSGSGKSSLAFETIYAEGQRRYMQSLSTYARQFLEKFRAPLVDSIENIPPTIALEQVNPVRNSRATVGTSTEIYDYLRLLFEKVGVEHCEKCDVPMERFSIVELAQKIQQQFADRTVLIAFQKKLPADAEQLRDYFQEQLRLGYGRFIFGDQVITVEDSLTNKKLTKKQVGFVIDRIRLGKELSLDQPDARLVEAIGTALSLGGACATVYKDEKGSYVVAEELTTNSRCPACKAASLPKSAISFSFNSPLGACEKCKGFGNTLEVDPDLIIPNPQLSLAQGAIDPFTKPSLKQWQKKLLAYCKTARIDADLPWKELSKTHRQAVFDGTKGFRGVRGVFELLGEEKYKMRIRVFISRYTSPFECKVCAGTRLNANALRVKVGQKSIAEICSLTVGEALEFFRTLKLTPLQKQAFAEVLRQLERRLDYLETVGLDYLTLSRLSRTLSGGEYQRILLATQLSQGLTDTMYVLDEPSIGLHPKDTARLLKVLTRLRELGNSVLVVEHDPELIEWAEYVYDMGPGSGTRGGKLLFGGAQTEFVQCGTETARAVKEWRAECKKSILRVEHNKPAKFLEVKQASSHNLQNVDVAIPLERLVAVTGVSGSGKSTLVVDTVYQALSKIFLGTSDKIGKFHSIGGFEYLNSVQLVDQSPIGKSSRSNPVTFVKAYDEIRSLFASTKEATAKRLTPGHFSFNVPGGRCDSCEGEGRIRVDMVFMEDIWIPCQICDEKRFKPNVLAIKYKGKSIDEVLRLTIDDAFDFFQTSSGLRSKLGLLREVGLGYLQLGQPGFSLSGGEAQRLKVARELSGNSLTKSATLFILDEPTTGLHFSEVSKLITVLRRLVASGHSVVVIEHNLQLICAADYVIDLGPDGGSRGGHVIGVGTPKELAQKNLPHTSRYLADLLA